VIGQRLKSFGLHWTVNEAIAIATLALPSGQVPRRPPLGLSVVRAAASGHRRGLAPDVSGYIGLKGTFTGMTNDR
jgi:hypothetical protein